MSDKNIMQMHETTFEKIYDPDIHKLYPKLLPLFKSFLNYECIGTNIDKLYNELAELMDEGFVVMSYQQISQTSYAVTAQAWIEQSN